MSELQPRMAFVHRRAPCVSTSDASNKTSLIEEQTAECGAEELGGDDIEAGSLVSRPAVCKLSVPIH